MAASRVAWFLSLPVLFAVSVPAAAGTYDSAYTKLDLDGCRREAPVADDPLMSAAWWCEGYAGIPVRVAEGDLRFLVSYGTGAASEPAAGQTLPQFNRIGPTLEWRVLSNPTDGRWHPVATILRYFTESESGAEGQVLVVTKLGEPGQVCHIGYVDALLNPDANAIARQVAEAGAQAFVCGRDQPAYYGVVPQ